MLCDSEPLPTLLEGKMFAFPPASQLAPSAIFFAYLAAAAAFCQAEVQRGHSRQLNSVRLKSKGAVPASAEWLAFLPLVKELCLQPSRVVGCGWIVSAPVVDLSKFPLHLYPDCLVTFEKEELPFL